MMADSNDALLSPVGAVWHYIRDNYPLLELYDIDESHPSQAGSFAAACSFYTVLFRKDPSQIIYNYNLSSTDATIIKNAVKTIVYDSLLYWNVGKFDPDADFNFSIQGALIVQFTNLSTNASQYIWDFGDSTASNQQNPTHTYNTGGNYQVKLIAENCSRNDTSYANISLITGILPQINKGGFQIFPVPAEDNLSVVSEKFITAPYRITVMDFQGRTVISKTCSAERCQNINTSHLHPGIYFLEITGFGSGIVRNSFVKE